MNLYANFPGATGYTPATDAGVNAAMRDTTQTETALANKEDTRLQRMRAEELRRKQEAYRLEGIRAQQAGSLDLPNQSVNQRVTLPTPAPAAAPRVGPNVYDQNFPTGPKARGVPPATPVAPPAAPAAAQPLRRQVGPGPNGGWDSYRAPLTPAQMQTQMDRLALLKVPALATDVFQLPAAAALNAGGAAINGVRNLGNRVYNAVTGEPTLGTNWEAVRSFKYMPFTDQIRQEQARLNEYQRGAINLNKPNLAMPAPAAPAQAPTQAPAQAQAQAQTQAQAPAPAGTGSAAVWDTNKTAEAYAPIIQSAAAQYNLDPLVLRRLIGTESSFRPDAVSPRGADYGLGIAQIAAVHGMSDADRMDPAKSIPKAAEILSRYIAEAGGDVNAALLRYKGASSEAGVASMAPIVQSILSGTQTQQTTQQTTQQQPVGMPTERVTPKQSEVIFAPENVANTQFQTTEFLRLAQQRLDENNRMLATAPDIATMEKLRARGEQLQAAAQNATYMNITARAANGDDNAMSSLALRVGVKYAVTNDGLYVQAVDDGNGNYRASGEPMTRSDMATKLYGIVTGATAKQSAAQAKELIKARAKVYENQETERIKGQIAQQNKAVEQTYNIRLKEIEGANAMRTELAKSEREIQKMIVEQQLDPYKNGKFFKDDSGQVFFSSSAGVFMYEPGEDYGDGLDAEGRMVPISMPR